MIFIYLGFIFSLEDYKKYYIETGDKPRKRLNLSKMSVRVTRKVDIESSTEESIDVVSIGSVSPNNYNIMLGEHYLMKNTQGPSVIVGNKTSENIIWTLEEQPDGLFHIKMANECIQIVDYDSKTKGHFLHVKRCDGSDIQSFRFIEIPIVKATEDKLSPSEQIPLEKKEVNAPVELPITDPNVDKLPAVEKNKRYSSIGVSEPLNDSRVQLKNVKSLSNTEKYDSDDIGKKIGERMKQKLIINSEGKFSEIMNPRSLDSD